MLTAASEEDGRTSTKAVGDIGCKWKCCDTTDRLDGVEDTKGGPGWLAEVVLPLVEGSIGDSSAWLRCMSIRATHCNPFIMDPS